LSCAEFLSHCRNERRSNVIEPAVHGVPQQWQGETVMKYMLLIYGDEAKMRAIPKEDASNMMPAYLAYTEALKKAGILLGGDRLQFTETATTVRIRDGKTNVVNGPYAEAKEQLAGYYLIDVPDMDSALSWASRCPGASAGTVEVRPLWIMQ
jgi:hypothetical protein